jgi:Terminase RNaseH-like domain
MPPPPTPSPRPSIDRWQTWPRKAQLALRDRLRQEVARRKVQTRTVLSDYPLHLRTPHAEQQKFLASTAKRKVIRSGRRSGKTVGMALAAVQQFVAGKRVLYAAPTSDQLARFWWEVCQALREPLDAHVLYKNETEHVIEVPRTENRIRAKTAWNSATLRGDYADELILDEWQLMAEEAWELVGAPMLLDNDGNATFIYTPRSLHSHAVSKAQDPLHAAKLFTKAQADTTGRWATFHFPSHANPYISVAALAEITHDMTTVAYAQEVLAEDSDEAPGALWQRALIERARVAQAPTLVRVVIGVDPPGGSVECGIVVVGAGVDGQTYILGDCSVQDSPHGWASAVVSAYHTYRADRIVAEQNYGGDMVEHTIRSVAGGAQVSYSAVVATRGKAVRAEPIAALYERGLVHHVGVFSRLEDELCLWQPGDPHSPNRLDALVWACTELFPDSTGAPRARWL